MALPDLIARLEKEAQNRIDAIERDADAEVRAIEVATRQAVAEITARHLEQESANRRAVHAHALAAARRQARARELEAEHAQIARILQRARELLPAVAASSTYRDALPAHLGDALSFLEGLPARVRCPASLAPLLQAAVRHAQVEVVIDEQIGPGLIAEASGGAIVVDNTLAARLAQAETRLTIELSRALRDAHA
jgi:vacuolar-type H+-ATPase subunit E/Vma4